MSLTRKQKIPALIDRLREAGVSPDTVAKRIGVARSQVYRWQQGVTPTFWNGADLIELAESILSERVSP